MREVKKDCRYFQNDRPCSYHKQTGVLCGSCKDYSPVGFKILIIKLDAMGDVLRTTCILQGLQAKYRKPHITWITRKESLPLLENNPFVDRILPYSEEALLFLATEDFDLVINPDASSISARLAELSRGKEKLGFGFDPRGYVYPFDEEGEYWFQAGVNDQVKKANTKTYQEIILGICRLDRKHYDLIYRLTAEEKQFSESFRIGHGLKEDDLVVGLNTGAGRRWPKKKWTLEGYSELIRSIRENIPGAKILLYGGPDEEENNAFLKSRFDGLIDTGNHNSLREFAALLDLSTVVVTGDTLAMHLSVALGKKTMVLFGPTSHAEIDLYGRGAKIFSDKDCLVCYRQECDKSPDCMESISTDQVFRAIEEMLGHC